MTATGGGANGSPTDPTPEEIGANYDRFTDLYGMIIGDVGEHLLDIGCGTGVNVSREHLARAEAVARSEGVHDRVEFRYGNAMDLDFPGGSFDAALSIEVFVHLSDRPRAFREPAGA